MFIWAKSLKERRQRHGSTNQKARQVYTLSIAYIKDRKAKYINKHILKTSLVNSRVNKIFLYTNNDHDNNEDNKDVEAMQKESVTREKCFLVSKLLALSEIVVRSKHCTLATTAIKQTLVHKGHL